MHASTLLRHGTLESLLCCSTLGFRVLETTQSLERANRENDARVMEVQSLTRAHEQHVSRLQAGMSLQLLFINWTRILFCLDGDRRF
jgi:hypothetical protein